MLENYENKTKHKYYHLLNVSILIYFEFVLLIFIVLSKMSNDLFSNKNNF